MLIFGLIVFGKSARWHVYVLANNSVLARKIIQIVIWFIRLEAV